MQRLGGAPIAPQDVAVGVGQEARRDESCLASGESLEAARGAGAGHAGRAVAPAQQALWQHPQAAASGEQAQQQIVVLRPASVAITEAAEHVRAHEPGRVCDRTLDEGFLGQPLLAVDRVEPGLVAPDPIAEDRSGKQAHVAADGVQLRSALQVPQLRRQPVAVHDVVGVHAGGERRGAVGEAGVQAGDQTGVMAAHDPEARIAVGEAPGDGAGGIGGPVVDDHTRPVPEALPLHALQCCAERRFGIEGRQQDGDRGVDARRYRRRH